MFIGVSGLIGAGKTYFTRELANSLGYETCYEPVEENPYLEDFYGDMARWTYTMQMYLLATRYKLHQQVIWSPSHEEGRGVVQDRTIYEDTVFARMHVEDGLMDERDFNVYLDHFNVMKRYLMYPDIIVYLKVSPETAMRRIKGRGRGAEEGMELEYLQRLFDGYELFAKEMNHYTVVHEVDWESFRPIPEVADEVLELMKSKRQFLRSVRRV